jgi:hypothetical protein
MTKESETAETAEFLWDERLIFGIADTPLKALDRRLHNLQFLLEGILNKLEEKDVNKK